MQFTPDIPIRLGQVIEGKYRIERILGQGGMGVVVEATHLVLEQRVAMKFLLPAVATNEEVVRRFVREARAAIKIRSEHVARVMDVSGTDSEIPFLVMEYLHGHDLSDVLKQRGPLPVRDAVGHVLQACEALGEAHAQGIVHRDLKPANLFLSSRADGTDCVKVLDFGISKLAVSGDGSSLTRTKGMMGSPLYMSPEQARSARNATTRSDIWSIGIVLYELLTGRTPFKGETVMELCADLLDTTPPPPSALRPDLPLGLDAVVMKCIEKEPANRFDNVAELAAALAPFGAAGAWESARVTARVLGIRPMAKTKRVVEMPPTDPRPSPLKSPWPQPLGAVAEPRDTVGSWGSTRRPRRHRSKSTLMGVFLGAGSVVVILVVVGLFFWWRSTSFGPDGASGEGQVGLVTSTTPPLAPSVPTSEEDASAPPVASVSASTSASSTAPPRVVRPPRATRPPSPPAASSSASPPKPTATKKEPPVPRSDLDLFEDNK